MIRDVYAHLEIDVAPGPEFSGQIVRSQLGQIEVTDVRTDSEKRTADCCGTMDRPGAGRPLRMAIKANAGWSDIPVVGKLKLMS